MKRIFSPATNPAGLTSLAAALYALGYGIWNVTHHRGAVDPQVIVAALAAVAALFTRQVVTPVSDPHDGAGRPLAVDATVAAAELSAQFAPVIAPVPSARRRHAAQPPAPDAGSTQ